LGVIEHKTDTRRGASKKKRTRGRQEKKGPLKVGQSERYPGNGAHMAGYTPARHELKKGKTSAITDCGAPNQGATKGIVHPQQTNGPQTTCSVFPHLACKRQTHNTVVPYPGDGLEPSGVAKRPQTCEREGGQGSP